MAGGRPSLGVKLVDGLVGSEHARTRLKVLLETMMGTRTIESAGRELGIGGTRLHLIRTRVLQAALGALEPRPMGRPPKVVSAEEVAAMRRELEHLRARCEGLEREATLGRVRAELHSSMPGLFGRRRGVRGEKKTAVGAARSARG